MSHLYTAEKAFYAEFKYYTDDFKAMGFDPDKTFCEGIEDYDFESVGGEYFRVSVYDVANKKIGTIDSDKTLELF